MNKNLAKIFEQKLAAQAAGGSNSAITFAYEDVCQLVNDPFGDSSPIQLKKMDALDYQKIPILRSVKYLADMIEKAGSLKLTKTGCLQRKVAVEIYELIFRKDDGEFDIMQHKVPNEADLPPVVLTRFLLDFAGLTKKRNGRLSLTRKWSKVKGCDDTLLRLIFEAFVMQVNWAYFDMYMSEQVGQAGFGLSLALISKYGSDRLGSDIYAKLYYKILPRLLLDFSDSVYCSREDNAYRCYSVRTFPHFLVHFNLVEIFRDKEDCMKPIEVVKTGLFDKFISCSL